MDRGFTTRFFFGKKVIKEQSKFDEVVANLYLNIKNDKFEDESLKKEVSSVGKDLTLQKLCSLLNTSDDHIMEKNAVLCKRTIYAFHAQNALKIKNAQLRADANPPRR